MSTTIRKALPQPWHLYIITAGADCVVLHHRCIRESDAAYTVLDETAPHGVRIIRKDHLVARGWTAETNIDLAMSAQLNRLRDGIAHHQEQAAKYQARLDGFLDGTELFSI